MTDTEFLDLAEQALETLEDAIDELNETTEMDVDAQRVGGMITLVFANRSQIVVNLQKPLHEIRGRSITQILPMDFLVLK